MHAPVTATVSRKTINSFSEHRVDDPNFLREVNSKDSTVLVELSYLTNPERLVGNAKHYFETLEKNGLFKGEGVLLFNTKSNLQLRNKMNIKNQLKTFIMEECFLNVLSQSRYIEQLKGLVVEIENESTRKLDDNIKTFAQNALDFTCPESLLTLSVICSSYASTYGELATFKNNHKQEYQPVQLEITYSFKDKYLAEELQHCRARFEAPMFLEYLKTYSSHFLRQIKKVQGTIEDTELDDISSFMDLLPDIPDIVETPRQEESEPAEDLSKQGPTKPKRNRRQ